MAIEQSVKAVTATTDPLHALECPMCRAAISAETIAGVCSSCPLYHLKNGCAIDLIACPQCGYHSLPREHPGPRAVGAAGGNESGNGDANNSGDTAPSLAAAAIAHDTARRADPAAGEHPTGRPGAAPCAGAMRLSEVRAGTHVRLLGFNGIDDNHLGRLTAYGMLPGVTMEVLQRFPAIILAVYQAELALETGLAEGVWVLPE